VGGVDVVEIEGDKICDKVVARESSLLEYLRSLSRMCFAINKSDAVVAIFNCSCLVIPVFKLASLAATSTRHVLYRIHSDHQVGGVTTLRLLLWTRC
jgi:hypothetical protein